MEINDVKSENNLRTWLDEQIDWWNRGERKRIRLDWIEPAFGSTNGQPDALVRYDGEAYGFELKHFQITKKGVCYKIRPAQRRYHYLGVTRDKKRSIILATINRTIDNQLVVIRGDHVPFRDYASDPASRCPDGKVKQQIFNADFDPFAAIVRTISAREYWPATWV